MPANASSAQLNSFDLVVLLLSNAVQNAIIGLDNSLLGASPAATIWVQASRSNTIVEVNLLEYVAGKRFAIDTVGTMLQDRQWQRVEVAHLVHRPRSRPSGGGGRAPGVAASAVVVDEVRVVAHKASFMTHR